MEESVERVAAGDIVRAAGAMAAGAFLARYAGWFLVVDGSEQSAMVALADEEPTGLPGSVRGGGLSDPMRARMWRVPPGLGANVGRSRSCEIRLGDESVSGTHLRVVATEGGLEVTDLASRNGTRRKGRLMAPHTPALVVGGEVLHVGAVQLLVFAPADLRETLL